MSLNKFHRSKILATIGPSSNNPEVFKQLLESGLNAVRLNTSHGSLESHKVNIKMIREVSPEISVLVDLPGIKIRTGNLEEPISVKPGEHVVFYYSELSSPDYQGISIPIDYKIVAKNVKEGSNIFINDGILHFKIDYIDDDGIIYSKVISGGLIESRKGINLPGMNLGIKVPTRSDIERINFAIDIDADFIAISFVSDRSEVHEVRKIIQNKTNKKIGLISKIEREEALMNFSGILEVSDGIMVARGDLGVEIAPERVPVEQRRIIYESNKFAKPVIVATQILDSMIRNPIATRAEISDIFTAVDQGADTLMLSEETATGRYPIKAVQVMHKTALEAHNQMRRREPAHYDSGLGGYVRIQELLGHAIKTMSYQARQAGNPAKAIFIPTRHGTTAKFIAKYRPRTPLIAASSDLKVIRNLNMVWGLHNLFIEVEKDEQERVYLGGLRSPLFKNAILLSVEKGLVEKDDMILVVSSSAVSPDSPTNLVGAFKVSDLL
ncbi:MAG: Pyruvate kinase [Candidatus Heimdallarchaeota archaeon LC_3]|nr:MAG: Pyruvate kinase [Candidatus Heimdallarchaeota archaeon LC_3]